MIPDRSHHESPFTYPRASSSLKVLHTLILLEIEAQSIQKSL